jgi:nitrite reductase/ring-hydroxylating ferredoxin subunit
MPLAPARSPQYDKDRSRSSDTPLSALGGGEGRSEVGGAQGSELRRDPPHPPDPTGQARGLAAYAAPGPSPGSRAGQALSSREREERGPNTDGFVAVAKISDLSPGGMKWVAVDGERRVLANVGGVFYALSDVCGHRNAPLSRGKLDGYLIECPLHYAQFDVRTGELVNGPVSTAIPIYEVRVDGDTVYVKR